MRTCTLTISIIVHVVAVCAAVIAPLFATDELPAPRTTVEFIHVVPLPEPPAPPPRPVARAKVDTRPDIPPLEVPNGIAPEPVVDPVDDRFTNDTGVVAFGDSSAIVAEATPLPPPPPPRQSVLRVGGNIRPPQKIVDVAPTYPPIAMASHVEGIVILEAVIAEDGSVRCSRASVHCAARRCGDGSRTPVAIHPHVAEWTAGTGGDDRYGCIPSALISTA